MEAGHFSFKNGTLYTSKKKKNQPHTKNEKPSSS
jgi:hypothetical protein